MTDASSRVVGKVARVTPAGEKNDLRKRSLIPSSVKHPESIRIESFDFDIMPDRDVIRSEGLTEY